MDINWFLEIVTNAGVLNNIATADLPVLKQRGLAYGITGEAIIDTRKINFCIAASHQFPKQHPVIFFLNNKEFEIIPHVEDDGMVCYVQEDAIVLDIDNPVGIVKECFEIATSTLRDGFSKKNEIDFYNEFEAYWRRLKNITPVFTAISTDDSVKAVRYIKFHNKDLLLAWNEDADGVQIFERLFPNEKKKALNPYHGVFIPLEKGAKIFVPTSQTELTTNHFREIVTSSVSLENQKRLTSLLTTGKREDLLLFSLPQPNGYYSLFGVRIKNMAFDKHPLLSTNNKVELVPLMVSRLDKEYMLARGGNGQQYLGKRVLVIGCGSIGGYICDELIKAAVINIDVVDKDDLQPDNCYRHVCGFTNVLMNKAKAIKKKLESFYPHAKANAINSSIERALEQGKIKLTDYDAIIVATGNGTLNQYLNRVFRADISNVPVLYCWLDPFGIGGHCLVTNITKQGCFQCLYANDDLYNVASFADKMQQKSFSKNISGCVTSYVPYGSLDAIQTALLGVKQLLKVFNGQVQQNAIYSWKGNTDLFLTEGYKLSPRYSQSSEQLDQVKHLFSQPKCIVCGTK